MRLKMVTLKSLAQKRKENSKSISRMTKKQVDHTVR